jgi:hypothetical protein
MRRASFLGLNADMLVRKSGSIEAKPGEERHPLDGAFD